MPRFYQYDELTTCQPMPIGDILWLAGQASRLPPFSAGVAVLCGSVAWGRPSWRSDIDVVAFCTESFPDVKPAIQDIIMKYGQTVSRPLLLPKADTIVVGAETQRLVTRKNLVRGSTPITRTKTIREVFASTGIRFFDHVGALAAAKGTPWQEFHSTYLSLASRGRQTRRDEIRAYVTSFADTWRGLPLRSLSLNPSGNAQQVELEAMSFAENFPVHLMRQILAERDCYPSPDRAPDVRASFNSLSVRWAERLLILFDPFLRIDEEYVEIVKACRHSPPLISAEEYHTRLIELFETLPFADLEEAVWDYLRATA